MLSENLWQACRMQINITIANFRCGCLIAVILFFCRHWLESRMDKRSPGGWAGEWRKHWLSGQPLCRTSKGAASSGVVGGCAAAHDVSSALAISDMGRNRNITRCSVIVPDGVTASNVYPLCRSPADRAVSATRGGRRVKARWSVVHAQHGNDDSADNRHERA